MIDLANGRMTRVVLEQSRQVRLSGWPECGVPIPISEVLSPATARYDRMTKRVRYQRSGVPAKRAARAASAGSLPPAVLRARA